MWLADGEEELYYTVDLTQPFGIQCHILGNSMTCLNLAGLLECWLRGTEGLDAGALGVTGRVLGC